MRKLNQKGFTHIEVLLVAVIALMISSVGYYVWHAQKNANKSLDSASKSNLSISSWPKKKKTVTKDVAQKAATDSKSDYVYNPGSNSPNAVVIKEMGIEMHFDHADLVTYSYDATDATDPLTGMETTAAASLILKANVSPQCKQLGIAIVEYKSILPKDHLGDNTFTYNGHTFTLEGGPGKCVTSGDEPAEKTAVMGDISYSHYSFKAIGNQ
jgi:hypothetical protein